MAETILYLPFNGTADGSGSRPATAQLTDAQYVPGRTGNQAVSFRQEGRAEIIGQQPFPLAGTYTLTFWLKTLGQGGRIGASWLLYRFAGDRYLFFDMTTSFSRWSYVVIIQDNDSITTYLDGALKQKEVIPPDWGKPTGFCLVNDNPATSGYLTLQDFTLYRGVDASQIAPVNPSPTPNMTIEYKINGVDFKQYGVYVSESSGVLDNLAMKDPIRHEWPGYHGEIIDLGAPRFEARPITLSCFIRAASSDAFVEQVGLFLAQFQKAGTQRLRLSAYSVKPHVYEVYVPGGVNLKKKWSEKNMVGTFELNLVEPEPIKRVLSFGTGTVTITVTSAKVLAFHWGDGEHTYDVFGDNQTVTHAYQTPGPHEIVIAGVIEEITSFSSNAGTLWSRL